MQKKIPTTVNRPRLYIFKSNKHIYAQIIDDYNNKIITSSSTISTNMNPRTYANCKNAKKIGQNIANQLKKRGINQVIFDRGKKIYHGQVEALANGAREAGIKF